MLRLSSRIPYLRLCVTFADVKYCSWGKASNSLKFRICQWVGTRNSRTRIEDASGKPSSVTIYRSNIFFLVKVHDFLHMAFSLLDNALLFFCQFAFPFWEKRSQNIEESLNGVQWSETKGNDGNLSHLCLIEVGQCLCLSYFNLWCRSINGYIMQIAWPNMLF